jgi:hypothetical protein
MEGSLVAYKVFTNGSVLQASEINENLMQQSTAVFSNAAARTAAITSPVEGQLTYLEDTNRYGMWNGSAWVSPFGMTLLTQTSVTGAGTISVDNVFTTEFQNYKLVLNLTSMGAGSVRLRFRTGGSDVTLNEYSWVYGLSAGGNTWTTDRAFTTDTGLIAANTGATTFAGEMICFSPQASLATQVVSNGTDASGSILELGNCGYKLTTSFNGVSILGTTMTGTLRIYGLRNA